MLDADEDILAALDQTLNDALLALEELDIFALNGDKTEFFTQLYGIIDTAIKGFDDIYKVWLEGDLSHYKTSLIEFAHEMINFSYFENLDLMPDADAATLEALDQKLQEANTALLDLDETSFEGSKTELFAQISTIIVAAIHDFDDVYQTWLSDIIQDFVNERKKALDDAYHLKADIITAGTFRNQLDAAYSSALATIKEIEDEEFINWLILSSKLSAALADARANFDQIHTEWLASHSGSGTNPILLAVGISAAIVVLVLACVVFLLIRKNKKLNHIALGNTDKSLEKKDTRVSEKAGMLAEMTRVQREKQELKAQLEREKTELMLRAKKEQERRNSARDYEKYEKEKAEQRQVEQRQKAAKEQQDREKALYDLVQSAKDEEQPRD